MTGKTTYCLVSKLCTLCVFIYVSLLTVYVIFVNSTSHWDGGNGWGNANRFSDGNEMEFLK